MRPLNYLPLELRATTGESDSPDGCYRIPHERIDKYIYNVVFSSGMGWEHMSVTLLKAEKKKIVKVERCPTWEEMCFLKDIFWAPEECCVQYHPAMADYISNHKYCLHIWKKIGESFPVPDSVLVGLKDFDKILEWLTGKYPDLPLPALEIQRILYYADASDLVIGDEKSEKAFEERADIYLRTQFGIVKNSKV